MDLGRAGPLLIAGVTIAALLVAFTTPVEADDECVWNGDAVYLDVQPDGFVSSGDVRITPAQNQPAGSRVSGGADQGTPLQPLNGGFSFFDVQNDGTLNPGDLPFWDRPAPGSGPSVADIMLADMTVDWGGGQEVTLPFGHVLSFRDPVPAYGIRPWPVVPVFDWADDDGDGNVDLDEPVYAVKTAGIAQSKDARISVEVGTEYQDGTIIGITSGDAGMDLNGAGNIPIRYADLDSSGAFGYPAGDAWSGCSEPWQQNGGAPPASSEPAPPPSITQVPPPQQTSASVNPAGSSQPATGGGGGGGGVSSTTLIVGGLAAIVIVYLVVQNFSKGKP